MKSKDGFGYNERLFAGGLRSKLHYARFSWFRSELARRGCAAESVLELGCFDGKLIDFLPKEPAKYVGVDANWEGGLDIAKARWSANPDYLFVEASSPEGMQLRNGEKFDVAVAMETLEHVPPEMVDGYLRTIAAHLNGYLFVTVPNEKGPLFLSKWLAKKLLTRDGEKYSMSELLHASLGRLHRVERNQHKGFDYDVLVDEIGKYFDVVDVSGHPFRVLPTSLCFGIGIVARSRQHA